MRKESVRFYPQCAIISNKKFSSEEIRRSIEKGFKEDILPTWENWRKSVRVVILDPRQMPKPSS